MFNVRTWHGKIGAYLRYTIVAYIVWALLHISDFCIFIVYNFYFTIFFQNGWIYPSPDTWVYPLCFLYGAWISLHSLSWTEYPSLVGILRLCAVGIIVQELLKHFFDYSVWIITREYTLSFLVKNSFLFWSKNTLFFRSKAFLSLKHFWLTTIVWSTIILVKNFFCQKHFSVINLFFVKTVLVNTFPFLLEGGGTIILWQLVH